MDDLISALEETHHILQRPIAEKKIMSIFEALTKKIADLTKEVDEVSVEFYNSIKVNGQYIFKTDLNY